VRKKRGQTGCSKETHWAKTRDLGQGLRKSFKIFLNFQYLELKEFQWN
jgi:hypothetical protein